MTDGPKATMPANRVILWTAPRSISNAFERSMRTLDYCKVFHEPYEDAYYLGPEKLAQYYERVVEYDRSLPRATFSGTTEMLLKDYPNAEAVFAKDLAYYVTSQLEEIVQNRLSTYTHTFLIRRPDKAVYSWYTCTRDIPNWKINQEETGLKSLYKLYRCVSSQTKPAIVIDADDLLSAPDAMMEAYCNAVGIRYKPGMTSWEPGMVHDWAVCSNFYTNIWYKSVAASSGFIRRVNTSDQDMAGPVIPSDLPEELSTCIRESWPLYLEMHAARMRV